jgi:ketosteroid isomerase-like protein
MSQENVEMIREQIRAFSSADLKGIVRDLAADAVLETDPRFPEGGTFVGVPAIEHFFETLLEGWHDSRGTFEDFREAGQQVLVTAVWKGTGEASHIEVTSIWSVLYTFCEGKIVGMRYFIDRAEALEAAGVAE